MARASDQETTHVFGTAALTPRPSRKERRGDCQESLLALEFLEQQLPDLVAGLLVVLLLVPPEVL